MSVFKYMKSYSPAAQIQRYIRSFGKPRRPLRWARNILTPDSALMRDPTPTELEQDDITDALQLQHSVDQSPPAGGNGWQEFYADVGPTPRKSDDSHAETIASTPYRSATRAADPRDSRQTSQLPDVFDGPLNQRLDNAYCPEPEIDQVDLVGRQVEHIGDASLFGEPSAPTPTPNPNEYFPEDPRYMFPQSAADNPDASFDELPWDLEAAVITHELDAHPEPPLSDDPASGTWQGPHIERATHGGFPETPTPDCGGSADPSGSPASAPALEQIVQDPYPSPDMPPEMMDPMMMMQDPMMMQPPMM